MIAGKLPDLSFDSDITDLFEAVKVSSLLDIGFIEDDAGPGMYFFFMDQYDHRYSSEIRKINNQATYNNKTGKVYIKGKSMPLSDFVDRYRLRESTQASDIPAKDCYNF